MKVLIVSETLDLLDKYNSFFSDNGFSTICYSWLIKAMDNIEEINPEIIFVNAIDYPRHWKVLIQNAKQVSKNLKHCIVRIPDELDDDEQKKLEILKVICVKTDFTQTQEANQILKILLEKQPTSRENITSDKVLTCTIPETGEKINGAIISYDYPIIIYTPNNIQDKKLFPFGKKFTDCTIYDNGLPSKASVQVQGIHTTSIEFCIIK